MSFEPKSKECEANYNIGQAVAYEEYSRVLLVRAKEVFGNGNDEKACLLRRLAEECGELAVPYREKWKELDKEISSAP